MWTNIAVIMAGYLFGSIPMGYLVTWIVRGVDVRLHGSGRTGGTNVLRAAGPWAALGTGVLDAVKCGAAIWVSQTFAGNDWVVALAGAAAVAGHNYSLFLSFKGGAGTAASLGGAIALWPFSALILLPALFGIGLGTRRASLASLALAVLMPLIFGVLALTGTRPPAYILYAVLTSLLTAWALRPNILRLIRGEERTVTLRGPDTLPEPPVPTPTPETPAKRRRKSRSKRGLGVSPTK